jgi:hypothetical protein
MKRDTKRVANNLKDITIVRIHRRLQDGVVPLAQRFPLIGILLRELGTTFDVREEEGDGAGGKNHSNSLNA